MRHLSLAQWVLLGAGSICFAGHLSVRAALRRSIPPDIWYQARLDGRALRRGAMFEFARRADRQQARRLIRWYDFWQFACLLCVVCFLGSLAAPP